MNRTEISRRSLLKGMGMAAVSTALVARTLKVNARFAVPNSTGTEPPAPMIQELAGHAPAGTTRAVCAS
jgi:hypothetical protein